MGDVVRRKGFEGGERGKKKKKSGGGGRCP